MPLHPIAALKITVYRALSAWYSAKSVRGYVTDYRVRLSELVADNLNGDLSPNAQAREHKKLLREYAEETFIEGLLESGHYTREDVAGGLDDEYQKKIGEWITGQEGFTAEFAQAVTAARLTDKRTDDENESAQMGVLNRVDLWASALDELGAMGRAEGNQGVMVVWKLGKTEQHCASGGGKIGCLELDGQRHRLKWFTSKGLLPRQNGNEKISCGGWNCDCSLVDDKGKKVY